MRRSAKLRAVALTLAGWLTLAACGGSGGDEPAAAGSACPVDALKDAAGPVEIQFWHSRSAEVEKTLQNLVQQYNSSQSKVKVVLSQQGPAADLTAKYNSAIGPNQLPDLVDVDPKRLRSFIDKGTLMPAESCVRASGGNLDQIVPVVRNTYTLDGKYWPGFAHVTVPVLYYNKAQFSKAGLDPDKPPATLTELLDDARKLKAAGVKAPLSFRQDPQIINSWLAGAGADIVSNGNGRKGPADKSTFDNPTTRTVYQWLHDMKADGLLKEYPFSLASPDHFLSIVNQTATMTIDTSSAASSVKAFLAGKTIPGLDLVAAPLPGVTKAGQVNVDGGGFYLVSKSSPAKQAAAWDFMKFMQGKDNLVTWNKEGSAVPFVKGISDDPALQAFYKTDSAGKILAVAADELARVDPNNPAPAIGPYDQFERTLNASTENLLSGGKPVDDVVKTTDTALNDALKQYNG
ncbi:ABC transporter substrate-binding protein [Actinocrispum wychmicini]|uniref:sn-glycerol 3-phosphate transport system substrate-binding protein n=1 Tax=Actinocrispum wychmicini TaxID=1213861 RepID=A0A4R2JPP4_9PSEU|nr:ABC transporter substrate-binding protein [Actinocrispum wychmicini]TCO62151.1 sn-glycerol 3-phosphate transport system substrate-binding protein [Actinocrispum wychmicini]